jgi:hypothetical protein
MNENIDRTGISVTKPIRKLLRECKAKFDVDSYDKVILRLLENQRD